MLCISGANNYMSMDLIVIFSFMFGNIFSLSKIMIIQSVSKIWSLQIKLEICLCLAHFWAYYFLIFQISRGKFCPWFAMWDWCWSVVMWSSTGYVLPVVCIAMLLSSELFWCLILDSIHTQFPQIYFVFTSEEGNSWPPKYFGLLQHFGVVNCFLAYEIWR